MSKFFTSPTNIEEKYIRITDKEDIHHLKKVLRSKVGDEIDISDGAVWEYKGKIETLDDNEVLLRILDKQKFAREPQLQVTLFQGIPKAGKMEVIIQKCVEMGIKDITPVFMERTVVVEKGNFDKKLQRWQKISDEAVKQCKRGLIPQINCQLQFNNMLEVLKEYQLVLFPYENENNFTIKDCLRDLNTVPKSVAIIIGPEGGFSDNEAQALDKIGAKRVSLGKTILRTETAGLVALAMTMYELEL
jgi:16S rRNA (uracil1498-N3)-methyltransferase